MREAFGNLWDLAKGKVLVLTTNGTIRKDGACVMGRGIAKEAKMKFPRLPYKLGSLIKASGNNVYDLGTFSGYRIISFPVKHNWWEQANIELIKRSARQLVKMADAFGWQEVYLPRPGCGNGRLRWEDVRSVLASVLDDRFIVCTWKEGKV